MCVNVSCHGIGRQEKVPFIIHSDVQHSGILETSMLEADRKKMYLSFLRIGG